jgi:methionyl-tRNA formyltransferase
MKAVVFAYHNVGVRCLRTLLAHGVEVPLVVSHRDSATENIWFGSVAETAARHDIPVITPDDPNVPEVRADIAAMAPDFIFSFYYRQMIKPALLDLAPRGAYNMHGSLLPKYRGRVPVNWAVLHGETETGATLHRMVEKPDAGDIVAQQAVPILPDDTAGEVFEKVTVAAEMALHGVLPALLAGTAAHRAQDPAQASYFSGRRPEDGRIEWTQPAAQIHNLVRAVAPPYPGAFFDLEGHRIVVGGSLLQPGRSPRGPSPKLYIEHDRLYADCSDGAVLHLHDVRVDGKALADTQFAARLRHHSLLLT